MLPINEEMAVGGEVKLGSQTELPEVFVQNQELKQILAQAINTLPEEQRMCVILRDIQGFSYTEISEILSCSLGTIKSRISRGRRALKDKQTELFCK